jgi:hypothetical protein
MQALSTILALGVILSCAFGFSVHSSIFPRHTVSRRGTVRWPAVHHYHAPPCDDLTMDYILYQAKSSTALFKWPGNRPPLPKAEFLDQRMDAAWGRGKFREEIWNDKVNPINDWWEAYTPSDEEVEAAAAGFDFKDPEGWFKVRPACWHRIICRTVDARVCICMLIRIMESFDIHGIYVTAGEGHGIYSGVGRIREVV